MRHILFLVKQHFKRKKFRTCVLLCSIIVACATLFLALVLSRGIQSTIATTQERLGADIVVVPRDARIEAQAALISGDPTSFYMPASIEEKVGNVPGVQQTCTQVYLRSLDSPCCIAPIAMVGFDPAKDFTIVPWVLKQLRNPLRENMIIIGAKVISAVVGTPTKAIGQRLNFMGKPFTVATILEPTGLGADYTVFLPMDTAYRLTQNTPLYPTPVKKDQISTVLVKVAKGANPETVAQDIQRTVPDVATFTVSQLAKSVGQHLQSLVHALMIAGSVFCVLAILLSGTLFSLSVRQRMREFGLFRAMGANRGFISRLIVLESAIIAGLGGLAGVGAGIGITWLCEDAILETIGNLYTWPSNAYFAIVGAVIVATSLATGILGGGIPARRILKYDPYEAIRQGNT
ncbi:MAG: ABC transporter permease [Desulfovibrio sp.]|jgi:putative ABC transport system permease protein|nr:ABC transporter permease [Desulfovibrio sp.]